jgi:hypothetical protein
LVTGAAHLAVATDHGNTCGCSGTQKLKGNSH